MTEVVSISAFPYEVDAPSLHGSYKQMVVRRYKNGLRRSLRPEEVPDLMGIFNRGRGDPHSRWAQLDFDGKAEAALHNHSPSTVWRTEFVLAPKTV